ncbi:MAG: hypothetical protein ACRELB_06375 [Polyangiaceae bacterium]
MSSADSSLRMRILPRTKYDLTNVPNITIMIAQHIDASTFQEADLLVRLHRGSAIGSSSTITIGLLPDGYDFADPAPIASGGGYADFLGPVPTRAGPGAVQFPSTTLIPAYAVASMSNSGTPAPFGRMLAVSMVAHNAGVGSHLLVAVVSIDLVLKGGDVRDQPLTPNGYCGYRIL